MGTPARPRAGEGWLLFSAIILVTAGVIRIFDAFWAFDKDDDLAGEVQAVVFNEDLTSYGWLWLVMGILLIAAGFGVLSGAQWARWFGIVVASISAITSMFWIYAFPIWALVFLLISFLVIYGLATYGGSDADAY